MNKIDEVLKLKELLDSGLINQSDFDRKKKEIFEETNNESKITNELISSEVHQNIQERDNNSFDKNKCPQCGSINNVENNDCIVCKTDLTKLRQPTETHQEPNIEKKQSNYLIPIFLISLLIIFASFFIFKNHQTSPNAEAAQDTTHVEVPLYDSEINQQTENNSNVEKDTWSILSKLNNSFNNIQATIDDGFVYITNNENGYKIIKIDVLGNIVFENDVSKTSRFTPLLTCTNDNKFILVTDSDIKLINENGEVETEKDIQSIISIFSEIKNIYCYENKEIVIIGEEYLSNSRIIKLDMEFNLLNEQNFKDRYNINGCHGFDCRDLEINSITRDNKDCYYFTGRNNHSLWIGKLDGNLNVIWEKNDFDVGLRNKPKTGLKIIYESDDKIFAISEYPVTDYSGKSYLISINSFGEKNWSTILKGSQYERLHNCMIKINNFLYVVTMYTDDYGARDYRTHNIPAYALLNKICFDGKIESSSEVFVDKNKISFKSITSNSKNSFFISGFVHALSFNKRNFFNSKTSVSKFNSEGKKGKNIIDYTNEGEND